MQMHDYSKSGFAHRSSDDFRKNFIVKVGKKYIKIGRKSDYNDKMGQVWDFVVNTDDDKLFQRGDVLKAAGFNAPARNAPRGNVLDGGFNIDWTGQIMVNQKEIDLLVYGHIYERKPKVWNKNINDIDWKKVKDTVYMDAYWKNYAHFTEIFNDVANDFITDSDVSIFDNGV